MGYGSITTEAPSTCMVHAENTGIAVALYSGTNSSISFSLTDELAKTLAAHLLASIQEREDAKNRRAA